MPDFLHTLTKSGIALEPALGNPSSDGYLLSSTTAGVRSWVAPSSGTLSGSGTSGRITQWTGTNTIGDSTLTGPASNLLTLAASSSGLTLTVPATGTAALRDVANTFTQDNRFNANVGIGLAPSYPLDIFKSFTPTSGFLAAHNLEVQFAPASNSSASNVGIGVSSYSSGTIDFTGSLYGLFFNTEHYGSGTVSQIFGLQGKINNRSSGTLTSARGVYVAVQNLSTGNITAGYGVYVARPTNNAGGTFGTNYGMYISDQDAVGATNYALVTNAGVVSFNDSQDASSDVRVLGSTDTALFYADVSADAIGIGTSAPSAKLTVNASWSATSTATALLTLNGGSAGTPAAGFGSQVLVTLNSSTTASRNAADLTTTWATATDASRKARAVLSVYDTAAREVLRGEASGSAPMIGFLGASAVTRQSITGDRQGNAALASLLTGLASEGLITDSTASATPTYTPTYVGGTSAGSTTYTSQTGVYRQVGDMVFFSAKVVWTAASGTGNARVSLPSTAANVSNQEFAVSVYHTSVTFANGSVVGRIQPNTAYIEFLSPATNAAGTAIAVEAAGTIVVSGLYLV
jgi:hypothetical protein